LKTVFNFDELKTAKRLPSPSGSAIQIMQLVQKDTSSVQELTSLIKTDPALTSRIIGFANSAFIGAHRPIVSLNEAVNLIGMKTVSTFALCLSLISKKSGNNCANFNYDTYWAQALANAISIATITGINRTAIPEEAFTLGLLSNIGRLALATIWPDVYSELLYKACGDELIELERKSFTVDHNKLTLMLLKDWGLPKAYTDAMKLSYELPAAGKPSKITRLAGQLAFSRQAALYLVADNKYRDYLLSNLQKEAIMHNLEGDEFNQFFETITLQWHNWGKLISINTDVRLPFPANQEVATEVI
jgi:two-component system, cell cycle response regulator